MSKKQTAVEWLLDRYIQSSGIISIEDIEQAKAMEREQIVEAWCDEVPRLVFGLKAEKYYERTYGKEASHEG